MTIEKRSKAPATQGANKNLHDVLTGEWQVAADGKGLSVRAATVKTLVRYAR
jgi:hypothetical protein